ncbi:oxidoreductase [Ustulina deusta]|nr:oxidoreductase [Ustulina deusta]
MADLLTLECSGFSSVREDRIECGKALVEDFKVHVLICRLHAYSNKSFSLLTGIKGDIVCICGPQPQEGWSSVGSEQTSKLRKENTVNRSADDLTDTRVVSIQIMAAAEDGLGLKPGQLTELCKDAASEIRMNHYPPISIEKFLDGRVNRTWSHTDFGLKLEDRSKPGTNTFQRWTNDVIRAGLHQVTTPPWHSCVFFFKASRDTSVGPLPQFVVPGMPSKVNWCNRRFL